MEEGEEVMEKLFCMFALLVRINANRSKSNPHQGRRAHAAKELQTTQN